MNSQPVNYVGIGRGRGRPMNFGQGSSQQVGAGNQARSSNPSGRAKFHGTEPKTIFLPLNVNKRYETQPPPFIVIKAKVQTTARETINPADKATVKAAAKPTVQPVVKTAVPPAVKPKVQPVVKSTAQLAVKKPVQPSAVKPKVQHTVKVSVKGLVKPLSKNRTINGNEWNN